MTTNIKERWRAICDEYVTLFCNKNGYIVDTDKDGNYYWIGNHPGGLIEISDMFVSMSDILYDIDNDVPKDQYYDWYWKSVDRAEMGIKYMNYPSYCMGCPDPVSPEQLVKIKEARENVQKSKKLLEDLIKDYKDPDVKTYDY